MCKLPEKGQRMGAYHAKQQIPDFRYGLNLDLPRDIGETEREVGRSQFLKRPPWSTAECVDN